MSDELKHYGVLGMRWGRRRGSSAGLRGRRGEKLKSLGSRLLGRKSVDPATQAIIDRANKTLNNPKSSKSQVDRALSDIGIDPKTGKSMRTKPRYDKNGKDISVNQTKRLGKPKGQSDRDFDAEWAKEMKPKKLTPSQIGKQKVADLEFNKNIKKELAVAAALIGTGLVVKHMTNKYVNNQVQANLVTTYGPTIAEILMKGK